MVNRRHLDSLKVTTIDHSTRLTGEIVCIRSRRMRGDGLLGAFVDVELEHVGARVVAEDVEVILAADDVCAVDFGGEDGFALEIRPGEKIAEGIDNTASAARDHGIRVVAEWRAVVGREISAAI